tara:strand:+ start:6159 stop:6623 length:465 start_codon:yes stop_codon:yes gene_type:complete
MNKIYKDVELAISQIKELRKLAKKKGYSTVNKYIIEYGEKANNVRYNNLSMEDIIDSKETDALYTANWIGGEFVVKILGSYTQEEIEVYGFQYRDYSGIQNIVYVKWDGKLHINNSTLTNGWSPSIKKDSNQVYKIKPLEANIFINWQTNPLNS